MRFARQARIFRGQIDAAPIVGVFFLLLIFLLLKSSLVFQPGVPVALIKLPAAPADPLPAQTVRINPRGHIFYGNTVFREVEPLERVARLKERLRAELPKVAGRTLVIRADPGTGNELIARVKDAARDLNLSVAVREARLELPEAVELPGLTDPGLVVSVDLTGKLYFENQAISEENLKRRLKEAVGRAREPLTLVVQADRFADYGAVVEVISRLAVGAGIQRFWLATQPGSVDGRGQAVR